MTITSGNSKRGSTADAMSAAVNLKGGTGGLNSRFFPVAGWFEAVARAKYTAPSGVPAWNRHVSIDPAGQFESAMRDEVEASWFWEVLAPMLESGQAVSVRLAQVELANAGDHAQQLDTLIEWLVWVGLVSGDGETIRLRQTGPVIHDEIPEGETSEDRGEDEGPESVDEEPVPAAPGRDQNDGAGALVEFNMSVRLTSGDLQNLNDEQMTFLMAFAEKLRGWSAKTGAPPWSRE